MLASVASVLGRHGISISKMQQVGAASGSADVTILTHTTGESSLRAAVAEMASTVGVGKINATVRVIK